MTTLTTPARLQKCGKICVTAQQLVIKRTILLILTLVVCFAAVVFSYFHFQPAMLTHPDFDPSALTGRPEVEEQYGFSTLTVKDGYSVQICGAPAADTQDIPFFLTNPKDNDVWLRAEILDTEGNIVGSTGVLKQGEYLPYIHLDSDLNKGTETPVVVRIISYEPNTWRSAGNVNLKMSLQAK